MAFGEFDAQSIRSLFQFPGADTREWVSFALVDAESDGDKAVEFSEDYGPIVNVTLQPSGVPVRARVAAFIAGNGEGEWFPFMEKDEVLVVLPEGNERNAVIIGRLNQSIDKFPTMVGGVAVDKNAVSFRRRRTPVIEEVASTYFLTSVTTNAALLLDKGGAWYVKDGAGTTMHIGADWAGFTTKDSSDFVVQMQIADKRFYVSIDGGQAVLSLSTGDSMLVTGGVLAIGTSGNNPFWHATTIESVCSLLTQWGILLAADIVKLGAPLAALAPVFAAGSAVSLPLAIAATSSTPMLAPVAAAILGALSAPPVPPLLPGVACAGLVVG